MRKIVFAFILGVVAILSLGIALRNHFWWRTNRMAVVEDGRAVEKPEAYSSHGLIYVQLPERKYEAYIIDFSHKTVIHNQPHRFVSTGFVLFSQDIPPVGPEFGKLERELPHFESESVAFRSDNGSRVEVRSVSPGQ